MNLSSRPSRAWYLDENIKKHKLVKVRITNKVSNYIVGSKTYLPGDIVGVPEEYINESFMERIEKPKGPEKEEEPKAILEVSPKLVAEQEPKVNAVEPKSVKRIRRVKKK